MPLVFMNNNIYIYQGHIFFKMSSVRPLKAQSTYKPRVPQCPSPRPNWDPHPLARKRVCPPRKSEPQGGTHTPEESQFGRVEKKLSTSRSSPVLTSCSNARHRSNTRHTNKRSERSYFFKKPKAKIVPSTAIFVVR